MMRKGFKTTVTLTRLPSRMQDTDTVRQHPCVFSHTARTAVAQASVAALVPPRSAAELDRAAGRRAWQAIGQGAWKANTLLARLYAQVQAEGQ